MSKWIWIYQSSSIFYDKLIASVCCHIWIHTTKMWFHFHFKRWSFSSSFLNLEIYSSLISFFFSYCQCNLHVWSTKNVNRHIQSWIQRMFFFVTHDFQWLLKWDRFRIKFNIRMAFLTRLISTSTNPAETFEWCLG